MRVRYRSRQNDRLRVMWALVHIDITPPKQHIRNDTKKARYNMKLEKRLELSTTVIPHIPSIHVVGVALTDQANWEYHVIE
ncbi:hypothetical protein TNCV_4034021 [Trichonephila clavipes]|nr:hypothetical protein TNCV_4034021 [Trichonephila clavipes]